MLWVTSTLTYSSTIITLFSFALIPLISNPMCLTSYSATLIDNIFTNNLSQNVLNGVVLNDLSDRLPVFAYFSGQTLTRDRDNKAFTRWFTDEKFVQIQRKRVKHKLVLTSRRRSQYGLQLAVTTG